MILINVLVRIVNSVFSVVGMLINLILMALPVSPFTLEVPASVSEILGKANYFIPLSQMVVVGNVWLVAIGVFYAYSVFARWAKAIQ